MNQPNGGWGPPQPGQQWGQPAAPPAQPNQPMQQQMPPQPPYNQQPPAPPQQQMPGGSFPQAPYQQQPPQGYANSQAFQQQMPPQMPQQQFGPPQGGFDDPFAGLTSGNQENRFPFLNAGHHRIRIDRAFIKNTRKGKRFFALELTVNATNNARHPVGSQATVFIDLGNEDMRGRHLSRLVCAIYGFDPNGLPKDTSTAPWQDRQTGQQMPWSYYLAQGVSEQNPWQGAEIGSYSKNTLTQRQQVFTIHHWRPVGITEIPNTPADETPEGGQPEQQGGMQGPPPGFPQGPAYAPPQQQSWQQGYGAPPPQQQQAAYPPPQGQQWPQGGHQAPPQAHPGYPPQGTPPAYPGAASPPWGGPPQGGFPGGGQQ